MRLIDAEGSELQTQLKIIREAEYQIYGNGSWGFTAKCEHAIENAPTIQPEPHWIPVTERLPESKEEDLEYPTVLITFENEEIMLGCFYESTKEWGTGEYFDKKCNPIAWMPLPEPYKGVTE